MSNIQALYLKIHLKCSYIFYIQLYIMINLKCFCIDRSCKHYVPIKIGLLHFKMYISDL